MVFFFPLQEQLVRPFPGAQRGKWFVQLAGGGFKLVEREDERIMATEVVLDGLDKHTCLKVRNYANIVILVGHPQKIKRTFFTLRKFGFWSLDHAD
jgi:hypothetical protein